MDISIADVAVHIDETLSKEASARLKDAVREDECVISASISLGKSHLMLVAFNPSCTTAKTILCKVTEQGVHAELVGL